MRVTPLFSPEDSDLASMVWSNNKGYAKHIAKDQATGRITTLFAHRLVGARKFGRVLLPSELVDHENRNKLDCQRSNLRLTTPQGNSENVTRGPFRGTTLHKSGKWQAQCGCRYIGLFDSRAEAVEAASKRRRELGYLGEEERAGR